jgi:hypothetical protein
VRRTLDSLGSGALLGDALKIVGSRSITGG